MQPSLGEQWLNMQGSTKHSICWTFGHDVRPHKCEANNEVISFAEQKKMEQREIYTQKTIWQNNFGKKTSRYSLGGHTLIMIGWWYQKSNSNEFKTACSFHWPQKTSHQKLPVILPSETESLPNSAELGRDWRELSKYVPFGTLPTDLLST